MVSHDLRHAAAADYIVYLEAGRILEQGTHEELLRRNGPYAGTLRMQSFNDTDSPAPLHANA
jgi:ATP-binding cassette, subfamily B, bacterial